MKHLKTFENFSDMGRFNDEEEINPAIQNTEDHEEEFDHENEFEEEEEKEREEEEFENPNMRRRIFGDEQEIIEKKKNPFAKYQAKKKAAKGKCTDDKCKDDKKESGKGLTASQKKLPAGLQKAILAKKK